VINIGRAFSYIFEDPDATGKLVTAAALGFVGAISLPILIGFVAWAALLGYQVELLRNLRDHNPRPLPNWDNYGDKISSGGNVIAAGIAYNLPNLLVGCLTLTTSNFWTEGFLGSTLAFTTLCCLTPFLLVYNLVAWPMLWIGLSRYADEGNIGVFFQFGDLFSVLRRNPSLTFQWLLAMLLASFVFGLLFVVPCIGWALSPALALPVQSHLIAQFTNRVERQPGKYGST
jgi:hypothetical protein